LGQAERELALADRYRYQVINDNLDQAVEQICDILTGEWEKSQND
jgi:guanylate kinase